MPAASQPLSEQEERVAEVWRENGLREATITQYLCWARRFKRYSERRGRQDLADLTRHGVTAFARDYAGKGGNDVCGAEQPARVALKAWAFGLRIIGCAVPDWEPKREKDPLPPLLAEYCEFRRRHVGVSEVTIGWELRFLPRFLSSVCPGPPSEMRLVDIDDFVTAAGSRWSRKTMAGVCSIIRSFLRFLHRTGRLPHDLASSVASPVVRVAERPPRALPWDDVQRLLGAIDVTDRVGRRDYALLLMMAAYGMGMAEALHLRLEDIDWRAGSLRIVRPKTGVETVLPLLPAIGNVLLSYLRDGRPRHTMTRKVFVSSVAPHGPMSPSTFRYAIRRHAEAAGLSTCRLGGHSLRHSHACQQVEIGASLKVLGDILGHRNPSSTSVYVHVATSRLRRLALPVPR